MLALGLMDGRVMLVDSATGEVKWAVQAHAGGHLSIVEMSPSGRFVASVSAGEEKWKLWDVESGAEWMVGAGHDSGACICAVDDLGHRVAQEGCTVVAHTGGLRALVFSPCGFFLATGGVDGAVILWDTQTGEAEQRMPGASTVQALSFSVEGGLLASGSRDGSIHVWNATSGLLLYTIPQAHNNGVRWVHFSTIFRIASMSYPTIFMWDVESGGKIWNCQGSQFAVISPDGRSIATGTTTGEVRVGDAQTGEPRLSLLGHLDRVFGASFSAQDGSKLASVSDDRTCKVWDSSTGVLLRTIEVGSVCSVWWGRDWVRGRQMREAFAMGHDPRLGARSRILALDAGVVRMILERL